MRLNHFQFTYSFPVTTAPEWADQVERWYQLDAAAYGVTELYWRHREELARPPDQIFLASPGASNWTDWQFASSPPSPSKFVHTLPNIRGAPLLRVMKWSGRVYCIQRDPSTIVTAVNEALHVGGRSWVVSAISEPLQAHIFVLGHDGPLKAMANPGTFDKDWLSQLMNEGSALDR